MSMDQLPAELLIEVARHLRHHDLAQFARVAHKCHSVASPMLWGSIDLHPAFVHDPPRQRLRHGPEDHRCIAFPPGHFAHSPRSEQCVHMESVTVQFLRICGIVRKRFPDRWRGLADRVKSLCLTMETDGSLFFGDGEVVDGDEVELDGWNTLLSFRNLEVLDVIGKQEAWASRLPLEKGLEPLRKLRSLRVRGYAPYEVVTRLYQGAPRLEVLDLGLLDEPMGVEDNSDSEDSDDDLYTDGGEKDVLAPRSLIGIFDKAMVHPRLTRLLLCKPAEPSHYQLSHWEQPFDQTRDRKILQEWADLLRCVRPTIVDLVLEHRVAILDTNDNRDVLVPLDLGAEADLRFCQLVLPVFFDDEDWPRLRSLEFRGIQICQRGARKRDLELKRRFAGVKVSIKKSYYMCYDGTSGMGIDNRTSTDGLKSCVFDE